MACPAFGYSRGALAVTHAPLRQGLIYYFITSVVGTLGPGEPLGLVSDSSVHQSSYSPSVITADPADGICYLGHTAAAVWAGYAVGTIGERTPHNKQAC